MVATKKIWPIERGTSKEAATSAAEIDLRDYLAFAHRIAQRHARFLGGDVDEALSAVLFALAEARQTWQPGAGASFASYFLIIARRRIFRTAAQRQRQNGVAARHRFDAGPAAKQPQQQISFALVSIDAPVTTGSDHTIAETIEDGDMLDPEAALCMKQEAATARQRIAAALPALNERQRRVIEARHLTDEPATLAAVGQELGVTREAARTLEARALDKLRDALSRQSKLAVAS